MLFPPAPLRSLRVPPLVTATLVGVARVRADHLDSFHSTAPPAPVADYVVKGQSVSRLTGKSTTIGGDPARYYVE